MLKFSVLMSVYKSESSDYLRLAIDSIYKNQSLKPNEIILVKDGNLNEDLENCISDLISKIPVLKVFGYSINKGLGYALNYGLKYCNNEIVFRMDADDISLPNRFEVQLLEFQKNEELVLVGSFIKEFNLVPGDISYKRVVPCSYNEIKMKAKTRNPFNHMTIGFKKSKIIEIGSYEDMPGYEDYFLWLKLLNSNFYCLNIPQVLVYARIGNGFAVRRSGYVFFKKEINFQNRIKNEGYISKNKYLLNIITRAFPRLFVKPLIIFIYRNILRK